MYAIFEDGGKQYKVEQGDALLVERRDLDEGQKEIVFDRVLMIGDGADSKVGLPWVDGATVKAKLVQEFKTPKVIGYRYSRRKGHHRKWGHRQQMLRVEISAING